LNIEGKKSPKAGSNSTSGGITSAGGIFANGAMLELVSGPSKFDKPNLLLWNGTRATVGPTITYNGLTYGAIELAPSLYRATRLPSRGARYGSARKLFTAIVDLFKQCLDLPDRESSLMACFSIGTWLADRLPTAPTLAISGPSQELGMDVLRLLSCICRHPLMLAEVTPASLRALPMQLGFTLLLDQNGLKPNMQRLFRASSYPGLRLPGNRGNVVDIYGPKVILCGNKAAADSLGDGVIHISVTPSKSQFILDEQTQNKIAHDFQPRLLMYRLTNSAKLHTSRMDVSRLGIATRRLGRTLAMCFPEDSELVREVIELLLPQDEEIREQRSRDVNCVIVEILLGLIHEGKQREVQVAELAKLVNALLRSREEVLAYSPEEIGWALHALNIPRHTSSSGRQVLIGLDTSRSVHRLAGAFCLLSPKPVEGCADCSLAKATN
jgi:hypothetical protein